MARGRPHSTDSPFVRLHEQRHLLGSCCSAARQLRAGNESLGRSKGLAILEDHFEKLSMLITTLLACLSPSRGVREFQILVFYTDLMRKKMP